MDRLHDVAAGRRRLKLNATCTKQSTSAAGMDDAAVHQRAVFEVV
ncbi:lysis protein [Enterobacteriaceae bacterium EKM102V]|nr:lysis protein [Enterobacteriaceae bacterium EKM102V]KAF6669978.1 lysis protein [Pantoea sp. EKM103V]